ncbi:hypothetical protein STVA_30220 [Allostella vacuolata]|nr:hypothetical protein STVA_30220 [Stella vacuolata]
MPPAPPVAMRKKRTGPLRSTSGAWASADPGTSALAPAPASPSRTSRRRTPEAFSVRRGDALPSVGTGIGSFI